MTINIHQIKNLYKNEKIEKQYILVEDNNEVTAYKISKNETSYYGELDIDAIKSNLKNLYNKKITIVHNHPADDPKPSFPDLHQYKYFHSLFSILGIEIDDYMIYSPFGYFSFKENNLLIKSDYGVYKTSELFSTENNIPLNIIHINRIFEEKDDLFRENNQFIITPDKFFYTKENFSGKDLFEISNKYENNLLFLSKINNTVNHNRILDFIEISKPIEVFLMDEEKVIPYKKTHFANCS